MRSKKHRLPLYGTVAAALLTAAATAAPAMADPIPSPGPIGPKQFFVGQVDGNWTTNTPEIRVVCAGPVGGDTTGHPVAGQTVSVIPATSTSSTTVGYTGDAANSVMVDFGVPQTTEKPLVITSYNTPTEIPTTMDLPCSGTGKIAFTPEPTSNTARTSYVVVTYVNIGV